CITAATLVRLLAVTTYTGGTCMTTVARPPVNEVAISISFEPQSALEGPRLLVGLGEILAEFPQVTEVQPYEMADERPFEERIVQPPAPQIQFVNSSQMPRRYWLTGLNDSNLLLQVQANYFALNWRRQEGGEYYPGFEHLLERFEHYLLMLQSAVLKQGGQALNVSQLELTYINLLHPDALWGSIRDVHKVVTVRVPDVDEIDQLSVSYSEPVWDESSSFYGRMHTAVSTGYQPKEQPTELRPLSIKDMTPVINISITTRSARIKDVAESVKTRFKTAHDAVTGTFNRITSDEARASWGLS
ncbi:MAG: TIGR04255 family protein, partial [Actinomycetota bacterium]|nr:TIGR04255 family protein [Actinomycetota bacterium]